MQAQPSGLIRDGKLHAFLARVESQTPPLRVLIVDDDRPNLEVMQMVLEMAGHQVVTAETGADALGAAERERPDTVLLDLRLPDQSGQQISAALRARLVPPPRIVITTGTVVTAREAERLGADAVLEKPFEPDKLLAVLR